MRFHVLGPVGASVAGKAVPVGGPKPRTLLALLAVHAGNVVPVERLIDAMWGEQPPDGTRAAVHTYVSTLRRACGQAELISRQGGGYLLGVHLDKVDLHVFDRKVASGRKALADGALEEAAACFEEALAQWRGTALGGAQGPWAEGERARLEELRVAALEDRADANLAMGRGDALVAELSAAVAEHPLRERLRGHLMLALHQTGRQADALACYREGRELLRDELGVEPGPALRAVHDRVLRADEEPLALPDQPEEPAATQRPSQLPFAVADFTGRRDEVDRIRELLVDGTTASRLCTVYGKPGAGKSTLAMHVAHEVRESFPDGQLYASLRGVQAVRADSGEVLAGFLRALGVPDTAVPADLAECEQLYRSLLADRRVLVVLDDAADEQQVRPLLPGGRACAALISGRERLSALDGARHLELPVFEPGEAVDLLTRVIGAERVSAEREAADEIVRLCGRLPLALRIAGGRLAARPQWSLARLVERLGVKRRVLRELTLGDLEVRGSLALSYDGLAERERTALRRLGLLDVSSFSGRLVATVLDTDVDTAEEVLERLVDAQLVDLAACSGRGVLRYQVHDLTRAFAHERGEAEESADEVRSVAARVAEYFLALVRTAGSRMPHAGLDPLEHARPVEGHDEALTDPEAWFEIELSMLVSLVERLGELDLVEPATRLAAALCSSQFSVRNLFAQWWRTHSAALAAARRTGDRAGEARMLYGLGWLRYEQDRFDEAADYYRQAVRVYEAAGGGAGAMGAARTRVALSTVQRERGQLAEARASLDLAIAELGELDRSGLMAHAVHELGRVLTEQGDLDAARQAGERAVIAYRRDGDLRNEAMASRTLGIVHRAAGRLDEAALHISASVTRLHRLGDRLMSAYAVQALAKVRIRQGRGDAVRSELLECLAVCVGMQDNFGQALVLRTLGELESAAGRAEPARQYLEQALKWWDALGLPVWRARTLRDLAALGDDGAEEAREIFTRHGCREAHETPALSES
ncbi:BTAD domain-containing putative transcriptional regulator [Actinosynnema sp. NPDC050436]|uniref:AfsR/SARP family transcriptional regulator n=1 Tax=Actinosynnema sp. NPDC050436 TaxID=3155659 RepID=UPI003402CE86